jgi:D-ribose pyranase
MKKNGLLHPELARCIAALGHGDMVVIGDAGLPVPPGPQRIDLAVRAGLPGLEDVLAAVLGEMQVESTWLAQETLDRAGGACPAWYSRHLALTPRTLTHEDFKRLTQQARVVVRTGECTPYANVILVAGVTF